VPRGIVSIGYQGRTLDDFVALLQAEQVETVVDVRLNASSRQRGFSKNILRDGLAAAGIGYEHCKALGSPKEVRPKFHSGDVAGGLAIYADKVIDTVDGQAALEQLAMQINKQRVAILCLEEDEDVCHRQEVIARLLKMSKVPVIRL
jgi:uncharacterized protein (DUF488 family)